MLMDVRRLIDPQEGVVHSNRDAAAAGHGASLMKLAAQIKYFETRGS